MIKISADSTCDLSPEILKKFNISIMPLNIIVGDQAFLDGKEILPADIFKYVDIDGKSCKTAAINVQDYRTFFKKLSSKYEAQIHICLGSGFSSCYQNAVLAAQDFENVYVLDSDNLSSGSGRLVYEAALLAKQGLKPEEIFAKLQDLVPKIETSFVIDRLDYLRKGGRCSALAAHGASLLKIKPCIEVVDGKMTVGKKYRGSFERALKKYVEDRLSGRKDIDNSRIFITHCQCSPQIIEMVKEAVSEQADFHEIIVTEAGATVATHCGPNSLGILFRHL
ncbi:MAG: DegV family protein [Firmicutes bacterium]|nr:DegV family protein [Bacillota bacterium]